MIQFQQWKLNQVLLPYSLQIPVENNYTESTTSKVKRRLSFNQRKKYDKSAALARNRSSDLQVHQGVPKNIGSSKIKNRITVRLVKIVDQLSKTTPFLFAPKRISNYWGSKITFLPPKLAGACQNRPKKTILGPQ